MNVSAGKVYTVGNGEGYGQVGMGNARDITHPVPIIGLEYEKITEIVSSSLHTLALNEKGEVKRFYDLLLVIYYLYYTIRFGVGDAMIMVL